MTSSLNLGVHGIYRHACVNCGGEITDLRLISGLPCESCIPDSDLEEVLSGPEEELPDRIYEYLERRGVLKGYKGIYELRRRLRELDEFFGKATGSRLWSAQRTWAVRVFKGESFSIVSPTGTGKSVFGIAMSIYISGGGRKAYIVVPTTPLVNQVYNRAMEMLRKTGVSRTIVCYHSRMGKEEREEALSRIASGDFDVLITTSAFLARKFDMLEGKVVDFIFVDDVDSVLKSSRNIDRILMLMGFSSEVINAGLEAIRIKRSLARIRDEVERERATERLRDLQELIAEARRNVKSVLVVSSATGRPRGLRVRLFRELLGFEVGTRSELFRNIVDAYVIQPDESKIREQVYRLVRRLGDGGLVFVPVDKGLEYAEELARYLSERGIAADVLTSGKLASLEKFVAGELSVLVGVAVYYGVMVRGLDLPERVRYAVFAGIPKFKFSAKFEDPNPSTILRTLALLHSVEEDEARRREIERLMNRLRRIVLEASYATLAEIREHLLKGEPPRNAYERAVYEALIFVREALAKPETIEKLRRHPEIRIVEERGVNYILMPDVMTYIQASGRTSRMYVGGLTKGLSVVIVDDEKLLEGLMRRSRWVIEDIEWKPLSEVDLDQVLREIDRDREYVRMLREGTVRPEFRDPIKTNLLIVESPNKARTIANFFGKPSVRRRGRYRVYEVSTGDRLLIIAASGGHVYDIITDYERERRKNLYGVLTDGRYVPIYTSIKRCVDTGYQFASDCEEDIKRYCGEGEEGRGDVVDKLDIVRFLQSLALEVDKVIIGTDPDAEGEKIGWDLAVLIRPYTREIERIEFHEVTKKAILKALENPRWFDTNRVKSQIVRRIEDRWIGFYLSTKLMEDLGAGREGDSYRALSAGRVQTPVLGWIISRWSEWRKPENRKRCFRIAFPGPFSVDVSEDELPPHLQTEDAIKAARFEARDVVEEEAVVNPPPPYTTATMIEDASRKLRISADEAMRLAQDLFEMGFITYHRTDSTRVSAAGQYIAREYFQSKYPEDAEALYRPRGWSEAGAHECIRPTRPLTADDLRNMIMEGTITTFRPFTWKHQRLYDMIFRRFMASQAAPARVRKQRFTLYVDGKPLKTVELCIEVVEEGFLRITPEEVSVSRPVREGVLAPEAVSSYVKSLAPLYRQGDVIRLMRERGIGRPSTYAKIMEVILRRGYVFETKKYKYLYPTSLGIRVYNYLIERYKPMVSEERTRMLERYMDMIEAGEADYQEILRELHEEIELLQKAG